MYASTLKMTGLSSGTWCAHFYDVGARFYPHMRAISLGLKSRTDLLPKITKNARQKKFRQQIMFRLLNPVILRVLASEQPSYFGRNKYMLSVKK